MKEYLNTNFSDIVYGENGFLVELRCNNTFQVQLFGKIKAIFLKINQHGRQRELSPSLTQSPYLI